MWTKGSGTPNKELICCFLVVRHIIVLFSLKPVLGQVTPPKKRPAPGTGAGPKAKAKKGELPPLPPDHRSMPHMQLLDEWLLHGQINEYRTLSNTVSTVCAVCIGEKGMIAYDSINRYKMLQAFAGPRVEHILKPNKTVDAYLTEELDSKDR